MSLTQLIYASKPFGFDGTTLDAILFSARHHNQRNDITGALICREDIFLQLLEGPETAVHATYARILRDSRHVDAKLLHTGACAARQFPDWAMRHDPARSWLWTRDEVWAGAAAKASISDIQSIFARIAADPYDGDDAVR